MLILRSPVFIACCVLFIIHQLLQWGFKVRMPLADHYLDNLLAMPVILTLLVAEKRWMKKKTEEYKLSVFEIIITTIYIILATEWLFPLISTRFAFDWLDVVVYFIGSAIYYFFINDFKG